MNEKVLEALTALAAKLGTTAEYLWAVLVKQAGISGALSVLCLLAVVAVAIFGNLLWFKRGVPAVRKMDQDMPGPVFSWIGWTVANGILLGCGIDGLTNIVTAFGNPEYWALHKILSAL